MPRSVQHAWCWRKRRRDTSRWELAQCLTCNLPPLQSEVFANILMWFHLVKLKVLPTLEASCHGERAAGPRDSPRQRVLLTVSQGSLRAERTRPTSSLTEMEEVFGTKSFAGLAARRTALAYDLRDLLRAPSMGPCLLERDLKHSMGPVLQVVYSRVLMG